VIGERRVRRSTRVLVTDSCRLTQTDFGKHVARAVREAVFSPRSAEVRVEAAPGDELPRAWFVAHGDGYLCGDCNERVGAHDVGEESVEVFEWFSEGWEAPCVCERCGLSMPVVIGSTEER